MGRSPRLAAATLLGAVGVLLTPFVMRPATAATDSTITISVDSPGDGDVITDASTITVKGTANSGLASIDHVTLQLFQNGNKIDEQSACCDGPKNGSISYGPNTFTAASNGPYQVVATATGYILLGGLAANPAQATKNVSLAVPPAAPTGVTATFAGGQITVNWKAVPNYPDLMGYAVYRKIGPGLFQPIAGLGPSVLTFTDTKPPASGGNVQYRVDSLRQGAVFSNNANDWLAAESVPGLVSIPVPTTTTVPGQPTTTTLPPGGGLQAGGAASTDLGSFFDNKAPEITLPPPAPPPTLPDTGYSETLPYGATTSSVAAGKVSAKSKANPTASAGTGGLDQNVPTDNSNRRALLVPIAAGSVLCVAALHLRWLNRRVAAGAMAAGAAASGAARRRKRRRAGAGAGRGSGGGAPFDQFETTAARRGKAKPVGAGAGAGAANGAYPTKTTKATKALSGVRVLGRRQPPAELEPTDPAPDPSPKPRSQPVGASPRRG